MSDEIYDRALAEAKARVAEEAEREGWPPSAEILIAWGVGAGVRTATKQLMREIGDAREELSRMKGELARRAALSDCQTHYSGGGLKGILGSHADIDLIQRWHHGFLRADYLAERLKLHINEAQRLALLVRELGGDPDAGGGSMSKLQRPDTAPVPDNLSVTGFVCVGPDGEPYWPSAQATVEESMARCFGRHDPHRLRLDLLARNGWRCVRIAKA